jgi:cytochrome c oxidase subunit 2
MMVGTYKYNITSEFQMFFHQAGSCQMEGIVSLYNYIMTYLVAILFVVTTALVFIILIHSHGQRHVKQFQNEKDLNELIYWVKYLQKWTHSTGLELIWTIIPTLILIAIAVPSFILLYSLDEIVDTQCVVKIIAYQWYWKYEYPVVDPIANDIVTFSYLSYMLPLENLTEQDNLRLLEVDTPLVLPTNVNIKLVITSKDVIHSFAVPALGIKMDAVPGRLNQVTVHIFKSGIYYGQCSELCGVNHAFMPIVINAVNFFTFETFLREAAEISSKRYIIPFDSIPEAYFAVSEYLHVLAARLSEDNSPSHLEEVLSSNLRFMREEALSRAVLTCIHPVSFHSRAVPENLLVREAEALNFVVDRAEFVTELCDLILFELRLLDRLPVDSPALNLGYGSIPDGTRTFTTLDPHNLLAGRVSELGPLYANESGQSGMVLHTFSFHTLRAIYPMYDMYRLIMPEVYDTPRDDLIHIENAEGLLDHFLVTKKD